MMKICLTNSQGLIAEGSLADVVISEQLHPSPASCCKCK